MQSNLQSISLANQSSDKLPFIRRTTRSNLLQQIQNQKFSYRSRSSKKNLTLSYNRSTKMDQQVQSVKKSPKQSQKIFYKISRRNRKQFTSINYRQAMEKKDEIKEQSSQNIDEQQNLQHSKELSPKSSFRINKSSDKLKKGAAQKAKSSSESQELLTQRLKSKKTILKRIIRNKSPNQKMHKTKFLNLNDNTSIQNFIQKSQTHYQGKTQTEGSFYKHALSGQYSVDINAKSLLPKNNSNRSDSTVFKMALPSKLDLKIEPPEKGTYFGQVMIPFQLCRSTLLQQQRNRQSSSHSCPTLFGLNDIVLMIYFFIILLPLAYLLLQYLLLPYFRYKLFVKTLPAQGLIQPFFPIIGMRILRIRKSKLIPSQQMLNFHKVNPGIKFITSNIGKSNTINFLDPQFRKEFHQKHDCFQKHPTVMGMHKRALGAGLIFAQYQNHSRKRKIFSQIFSYQFLNSMTEKISKILCQGLQLLSQQNSSKQILYELNKLTSKVICQCFLGVACSDIKIEGLQLSVFFSKLIAEVNRQAFSFRYLLLGKCSRELQEKCLLLQQALKEIVKERVRSKGSRQSKKDLMYMFLERTSSEQDQEQVSNQVLQQFKNFFFAGSDTTAHLISFALYYLSLHPHLKQQIASQVSSEKYLDANFSKNHIKLNSFIKQVQRIYGPVNGVATRLCSKQCYIGELFIPKGTVVSINSQYSHHSQQFYEKPHEFRPQRWWNGQTQNLNPFAFVPFSSGARNCIGQHLALLQARILVSQICRSYQIEVKEMESKEMKLGALPFFRERLMVKLRKVQTS